MEFPVQWLPALLHLLIMGAEVLCDCTVENMQIEGGTYKLTRQLQEGSRLMYSCPKGYYPDPVRTYLCQANGSWTPAPKTFPRQRCKVVECPDPSVLLYGSVSPPQQRYFVGNETTTECYSGYTMRGSVRRVCLSNGKWSGRTPICSRDTGDHCADPGIPAGASRTGNSFGIGDRVRYQCNSELSLMGSDERVCQESGQWTGIEPSCYYKYTYDTPEEAGQTFGRKILERLNEMEMIDDEEEVRGLCGLHQSYETLFRNSNRNMYPWAASVIVTKDLVLRTCAGSLVTPQFVLTAAHCFMLDDQPEDVGVHIDGRRHIVKRMWIHPLYNVAARKAQGVSEFYDYDVALVRLTEDVVISTAVRPICIPCTQQTSDALRLNLTCTEQEQILLNGHFERLQFLTKTRQGMRPKEVLAKLRDNRAECISHVLKAGGITATDPNVAVTDNFLCTGGRIPFRDHIACPGDGGGAVFKNYERRTIQVALVSWGTKNLCIGGSGGGLIESDDDSRDFHLNLFRVVPFLKSILGNDTQDEYAPLKFLDD